MKKQLLKLGIVTSIMAMAFVAVFSYYACRKSSYISNKNLIVDPATDENIVALLSKEKISTSPIVTKLCLKLGRFLSKRFTMGEYELPNNVSIIEALEIISSGKIVVHKICFPEGITVADFIKILNKNKFLLGEVLDVPPEGSLLPDTYTFKYPTTKQDIMYIAQQSMKNYIKKAWNNRPEDCPLESPEDVIKLASVVEKEYAKGQAPLIAGIFLNRLKIGMRLQSDPTVIYAITKGESLGRKLKFSDLKKPLPGNTYVFKGLPDTPICNPGTIAITSVFYPEKHDYIYFVHGKHAKIWVAKTFEEHKINIKKAREQK